ncbi:MAG TPA: YetF domain-containing protein [Chthoniobacterales bacterium]|jgi:uncharacterized membrane protein YcaP (DUF421 family)|nr:YetF domain-containing protein [Chthoniobacterales bacterium]
MDAIWRFVYQALGLASEPHDLTFVQVTLRGIIVFFAALVMIRLGDRRSLTQKSAFDLVFIVIIGSVLARAINGSGPFFATVAAGLAMVLLHRLLAWVFYRWPALSMLAKGRPIVLVKDGAYQRKGMRAMLISELDLEEDLRLEAQKEDKEKVQTARLEPSGDISFILKEE